MDYSISKPHAVEMPPSTQRVARPRVFASLFDGIEGDHHHVHASGFDWMTQAGPGAGDSGDLVVEAHFFFAALILGE